MGPRLLAALVAALAAWAPDALAATPETCGAERPERVVTGEFSTAEQGAYVLVPFEVPAGTTAVRAWYCYDSPDARSLPGFPLNHTLDFGLYERRPAGRRMWTMEEFRGWSGSGFFSDITVSPEGYAEEADPGKKPVGATSRGYRPGPIPPGTWAFELGVAAVVPPDLGDADGRVAWRVELVLEEDFSFADRPYVPAPYDERPAKDRPGWYTGDFHVHTDQSGDAKQRALATKVFDHAFRRAEEGGAGLDFVQATDHNTDGGWGEWGRLQGRYRGHVIGRNAEITTYGGHVNSPGLQAVVDYRVGPVLERRPDGSLEQLRPARPISELFDEVHAKGGVTQLNHPTIFDSSVPPLAIVCRGCSWEYDDVSTGYPKVDAIEVATGPQGLRLDGLAPGPNPFTPLAVDFFDRAVQIAGHPIAALGSSDSHTGGDAAVTDATASPVGTPSTALFANALSEEAVAEAVRAGHTYAKLFGARSPDLRLEAKPSAPAGAPVAIMGDGVVAPSMEITAKLLGDRGAGPEPLMLLLVRDGEVVAGTAAEGGEATLTFTATAPTSGFDAYRLQAQRGSAIEAISSPIALAAPGHPPFRRETAAARDALRLRVRPIVGERFTLSRSARGAVRCRATGAQLRLCRVVVKARSGRRIVTVARGEQRMTPGTVWVTLRTTATGRAVLRRRRGRARVSVTATAVDATGQTAVRTRRVRAR